MSSITLSKLSSIYGASLGRAERHLEGNVGPVKLNLVKLVLNYSGYDAGGAYWGIRPRGVHLWAYQWKTGNLIRGYIDAPDREDAKRHIRGRYPEAVFYN